ncbi:MAG TPA: FtsQ-type POTRA domain-containing protein [Jiangellaceae bacterium]
MSRAPAGADRFAARSRRRRLGRLLWSFGAVLAVSAVAALAWLVGWSDFTAVDRVEISGVGGKVEKAVRDAADVPEGMPLIRVDTDAIDDRVQEIPEVAGADVRRGWPRTVEIDISVREPAATLQDGDTWWSVDDEGVVFGASATRNAELIELVADPGSEVGQVSARVAAIEVLAGLPEEVTSQLAAVEAPSEAAIELVLTDERRVLWGTAAETARKAEVLGVLMAEVPDASSYNVSAPDFPSASE